MQAKRKHSPAFLTTTRPLTNDERLWDYERRKRDHADKQADDMRYLGVWSVIFILAVIAGFYVMLFPPCLWIWSGNGIECIN